jgi:hypothetical protein
MKISKFFCMLIAGLAIIGFTTVGMASEEHPKAEASEAEAEAAAEGESVAKEESKAESKEEIQYGALSELDYDNPELKSGEEEAKAEEKE